MLKCENEELVKMKIERISDNKIKILINSEDVKNWNVNIKKLTDNTPEAQNLFWYAIRKAEKEVDFLVGSSKLLVEAIPVENDGFVMIISKVDSEEEFIESIAKNANIRHRTAEIKIRRVEKKKEDKFALYKFSSFDDLCNGVGEIRHLFIGNSSVYKYYDEFYLMLEGVDMFRFYEIDCKISEFAVEYITNSLSLYEENLWLKRKKVMCWFFC